MFAAEASDMGNTRAMLEKYKVCLRQGLPLLVDHRLVMFLPSSFLEQWSDKERNAFLKAQAKKTKTGWLSSKVLAAATVDLTDTVLLWAATEGDLEVKRFVAGRGGLIEATAKVSRVSLHSF